MVLFVCVQLAKRFLPCSILTPACAQHQPTGGAGAVAMLVGPNAPLILEPPPWRATFSAHCFGEPTVAVIMLARARAMP